MRRGIDGLSAMVEAVIKGSAYSTRFSSADTFLGRRRKMVLRI
ncbi:hypothetical protein [Rhizobium sp. SL42]